MEHIAVLGRDGLTFFIAFQHGERLEFSEVDYTGDLKRIDIPVLVAHGDDDQIVPIKASALKTAKIVENARLKVYPGGCHGFAATNADELNADLLAFVEGKKIDGAD